MKKIKECLVDLVEQLMKNGYCALTNSDAPLVHELYDKYPCHSC